MYAVTVSATDALGKPTTSSPTTITILPRLSKLSVGRIQPIGIKKLRKAKWRVRVNVTVNQPITVFVSLRLPKKGTIKTVSRNIAAGTTPIIVQLPKSLQHRGTIQAPRDRRLERAERPEPHHHPLGSRPMQEARLQDPGSGLGPTTKGWFTVNVRDALWLTSEGGKGRPSGSECPFETPYARFEELAFRLHVLPPGQPNGLYHAEQAQEDFLVLSGECTLLVEGEERRLQAWDFFHSPAGTEHIFVGAGTEPCVILMTGTKAAAEQLRYPVSSSRPATGPAQPARRPTRTRPTRASSPAASRGPRTGTASPGIQRS